jgi:hypothetical protein
MHGNSEDGMEPCT